MSKLLKEGKREESRPSSSSTDLSVASGPHEPFSNGHDVLDGTPPCSIVKFKHFQRWEIYQGVNEIIGKTPIVRLQRMAASGVNVYVKCENLNPGGSLKDRLALGIIEWAELHGHLKPGQTVVEASSGNTGK